LVRARLSPREHISLAIAVTLGVALSNGRRRITNYDHKPLIVKVDCKIVYEFCFAVLGAIDAGVSAQLPQGKGARTDIGDAREASGQVGLRRGHLVFPLANNALSAVSVAAHANDVRGQRSGSSVYDSARAIHTN
jgi:hypothetical protein